MVIQIPQSHLDLACYSLEKPNRVVRLHTFVTDANCKVHKNTAEGGEEEARGIRGDAGAILPPVTFS